MYCNIWPDNCGHGFDKPICARWTFQIYLFFAVIFKCHAVSVPVHFKGLRLSSLQDTLVLLGNPPQLMSQRSTLCARGHCHSITVFEPFSSSEEKTQTTITIVCLHFKESKSQVTKYLWPFSVFLDYGGWEYNYSKTTACVLIGAMSWLFLLPCWLSEPHHEHLQLQWAESKCAGDPSSPDKRNKDIFIGTMLFIHKIKADFKL